MGLQIVWSVNLPVALFKFTNCNYQVYKIAINGSAGLWLVIQWTHDWWPSSSSIGGAANCAGCKSVTFIWEALQLAVFENANYKLGCLPIVQLVDLSLGFGKFAIGSLQNIQFGLGNLPAIQAVILSTAVTGSTNCFWWIHHLLLTYPPVLIHESTNFAPGVYAKSAS